MSNFNSKLMQVFGNFSDLLKSKEDVDNALIDTAKGIIKVSPEVLDMDFKGCKEKMPEFANSLMMSQYAKDSKLMAYCKKAGLFKKSVNDGIFMLTRKKAEIVKAYGDTVYFQLKGSNIKGEKKVQGLCHNAESNHTRVFNKIKSYAKNKGGKNTTKQHVILYLSRNLTKTISPLNSAINTKDKYSQSELLFLRSVKADMDAIHKKAEKFIKDENIKEIQ